MHFSATLIIFLAPLDKMSTMRRFHGTVIHAEADSKTIRSFRKKTNKGPSDMIFLPYLHFFFLLHCISFWTNCGCWIQRSCFTARSELSRSVVGLWDKLVFSPCCNVMPFFLFFSLQNIMFVYSQLDLYQFIYSHFVNASALLASQHSLPESISCHRWLKPLLPY